MADNSSEQKNKELWKAAGQLVFIYNIYKGLMHEQKNVLEPSIGVILANH